MKPPLSNLISRPAVRYGLASIAAFSMDLALTMALRLGGQLSLTLSAAIAFIVTGLMFYFVHEFWTFGHDSSTVSSGRLVRNLTSLGAAFCVRVGIIGALELMRSPGPLLALVYFGSGAAASLTVNFLINKYWVFTRT